MLKPVLLLVTLCVLLSDITAAKTKFKKSPNVETALADTIFPQYKYGSKALYTFLTDNVRFPDLARRKEISGKVFVSFTVETDGSLTGIEASRKLGYGCDEEALRVIGLTAPWIPGTVNGTPIAMRYTVPFHFDLQRTPKLTYDRLLDKDYLVYYFRFPMLFVTSKDSADYIRIVYAPKGQDKLFIINEFYMNGKPKLLGSSYKNTSYLQLHGECLTYYPNGKLKSVSNYNNAKKTGPEFTYYENGRLNTERWYDIPTRDLRYTTCKDSLGNTIAENGNGRWVEYNTKDALNFDIQSLSGQIKNYQKEGEWVSVYNNRKQIETYKQNEVTSSIDFYLIHGSYVLLDDLPVYKGKFSALGKYLNHKLKYPKEARKLKLGGTVKIELKVNTDGSLQDLKLLNGIGHGCEDECIEAIKASFPWQPVADDRLKETLTFYVNINFDPNEKLIYSMLGMNFEILQTSKAKAQVVKTTETKYQ